MKIIFIKTLLALGTAGTFVFAFFAFAAPPASPYMPGEALAPACDPGTPNCTVESPLLSGIALGADGKVLKISSGAPGWADDEEGTFIFSAADYELDDFDGILSTDKGGTGLAIFSAGDIFYASNSTTLSLLPVGTNGQVLKISSGIPSWQTDLTISGGGGEGPFSAGAGIDAASLSSDIIAVDQSALNLNNFANTLSIAKGGTGAATASGALNALGIGNVENIALSSWTGSANITALGTIASGSVPFSLVSGTVPVLQGGTGQTSYTDGQLLIGNSTGNTLTKATLTAGTGISITNGAGSITVANAAPAIIAGTSDNSNTANGKFYALSGDSSGNGTDASAGTRTLVPRVGTIKNLYVILSVAPGAGKTNTYTIYKNGVATSLVAAVSNSATAGNDTAHTVSVAAGDEVSINVASQTNTKLGWSVEFTN